VSAEAFEVEATVADQSELDAIVDRLRANSVSIWSLRRRQLTLEEAFLRIVEESR
jgi:hypothetical protein